MKLKSIERTLTNDQFKQRAKKIHKNLYDYSNSKYKTIHEKVEIICKKHGSFFQAPSAHLSGKGCKKCSIEYIIGLKRNSIEELIKTFNKIHENFYDYSNFKEYKNGQYKTIAIFSKLARGLMTRHIVETNAQTVDDLKTFNAERYAFDANLSTENKLVFTS